MTIEIAQNASPKDDKYWSWSVWIEGSDKELKTIKEVVWNLHPTFTRPICRVDSRDTKFKLETSGWGEFEIVASVRRANGKTEVLRHWLELHEDDNASVKKPRATAALRGSIEKQSLFVSYTLEYAAIVSHLVKALRSKKFDVTFDLDVPAGVEYRRWIVDRIASCDALILIGGNDFDKPRRPEVDAAVAREIRMIAVVMGGATLPKSLESITSIPIKGGNPKVLGAQIADRIATLMSPPKTGGADTVAPKKPRS